MDVPDKPVSHRVAPFCLVNCCRCSCVTPSCQTMLVATGPPTDELGADKSLLDVAAADMLYVCMLLMGSCTVL